MKYNFSMINLDNVQRIVFKFGTNVLRGEDGEISLSRIYSFIEDISKLHKKGKEVLVVTSGAVGLGAGKVHVDPSADIVTKQACAAIGQTSLMSIYEHGFDKFNITCAQVLLTEEDLSQRVKYLSLSNVLDKLLELRIIPIINQNDTVNTAELEEIHGIFEVCFSDNDKLSALVSSRLGADLLVILSDIDALYDDNPKENPNAKRIAVVDEVTPEIEKMGQSASKGGRGGMKTKLEAAKVVTRSGGHVIIANGKTPGIIRKIFTEEDLGTIFNPTEQLTGRKRWIGYATNITGKIKINYGAKKALLEKEASLLSIGVLDVLGEFKRGEVVTILDEKGNEFAKGMVNYGSNDCRKIMGQHSEKILELLGYKNYDAIITRDNIVIL